jgi:hypothetical protein
MCITSNHALSVATKNKDYVIMWFEFVLKAQTFLQYLMISSKISFFPQHDLLCVINSSYTARLTLWFSKLWAVIMDTLKMFVWLFGCDQTLFEKITYGWIWFFFHHVLNKWYLLCIINSSHLAFLQTLYMHESDNLWTFLKWSSPSVFFIYLHQLTTVSIIDECFLSNSILFFFFL